MANEAKRKITVLQSRHDYASENNVPSILLQGIWLKDLGFKPGDFAEIECDQDTLIIHRKDRSEAPVDPEVLAMREKVKGMTGKQKKQMMEALLMNQ